MKLEKIVGIPVHEAEKLLHKAGKILRIVKKDEKNLCCTCEYNENRVNVEVAQNTIVQVVGEG